MPVVIELRLRRLTCVNLDCTRQTFHEQVPGLAGRYGRRTPGATALVIACGLAPAGRGGAALPAAIGFLLSRTSVLSVLMAVPEPAPDVRCFRDIATGQGRSEGPTARRTRSRHAAIHALLSQHVPNRESPAGSTSL